MLKKTKKNGFYKLINKKTGKVKILKQYKNELLDGKFIYYWDNGQIHITGQYNKAKRIGLWKTYNQDGNLISKEYWGYLEKIKKNLTLI